VPGAHDSRLLEFKSLSKSTSRTNNEGSVNPLEGESVSSEELSSRLADLKTPERKCSSVNARVWCKPFYLHKKKEVTEEHEVKIVAVVPKEVNIRRSRKKGKATAKSNCVRSEEVNALGVKAGIQAVFPCNHPTCSDVKMSSLLNWRRHMKNIHKIYNADFSMVKHVSKIDPLDFRHPKHRYLNDHEDRPPNDNVPKKRKFNKIWLKY